MMAKPPKAPPHSDLDGVHQDGTRPGKILRKDEGSAKELGEAKAQSRGRPAYEEERPKGSGGR